MFATFDRFEIRMTLEQAKSVSGRGHQIDNVRALLKVPDIAEQFELTGTWAPTTDKIRAELNEYGAWDDAQLSDDNANRERILWIAGCNIAEGNGVEE